jgi:hypothetical protein
MSQIYHCSHVKYRLTVIIEFDTYYRVKTELELYLIIVDYLLITIAYYYFNRLLNLTCMLPSNEASCAPICRWFSVQQRQAPSGDLLEVSEMCNHSVLKAIFLPRPKRIQ